MRNCIRFLVPAFVFAVILAQQAGCRRPPTPKEQAQGAPVRNPIPGSPPISTLPPKPASEFQATGDPVEDYLRQTAATRDPYMTVNALIFRPEDPRLKYEPAGIPAAAMGDVFAKLGPLASFADPSRGPAPSKQTDPTEARMITDTSMVGSGRFNPVRSSLGETLLVFLDHCKRTMADVRQVYGNPVATVRSGKSRLHFYGRVICVENASGKIHAVLRRKI